MSEFAIAARRRPRRGRITGAFVVSIAAALTLAPVAAHAGTISASGSTVTYQAGAGEANSISVTQLDHLGPAQNVVLKESANVPLTGSGGCSVVAQGGSKIATCPIQIPTNGWGVFKVLAGDQSDSIVTSDTTVPGGTWNENQGNGGVKPKLVGGSGSDYIKVQDPLLDGGNLGPYYANLIGCEGDDTLIGGYGRNVVAGDQYTDPDSGTLCSTNGAGNDVLEGGRNGDTIIGGGQGIYGADTVKYVGLAYVASQTLNLTIGDGQANDGTSSWDGALGADKMDNVQGDVENVITGDSKDNIVGTDGPNVIDPGNGPILGLDGRGGSDTLSYSDVTDPVYTLSTNLDSYQSIENFSGNKDPNVIYGTAGANSLSGNGGDDILYGKGGNDSLFGGADSDYLLGDSGQDTMIGSTGGDKYIDVIPNEAPDTFLDGIDPWIPNGGSDTFLSYDGTAETVNCGASDSGDDLARSFWDTSGPIDTLVGC